MITKTEKVAAFLRTLPSDIPNRTAAIAYAKENPATSVERARHMIRRVRGNCGKKYGTRPDLKRPNGIPIPPQRTEVPEPIKFVEDGFYLLTGDWHVPYHDQRAMEVHFKFALDQGCDGIYINGDFADNYAFSKWFKDPRQVKPGEDLATIRQLLSDVAGNFGKRIAKIGNHDERYQKYIISRAPELLGVEELCFEKIVGLHDLDFDIVESSQLAFLGDLPIVHGHELPRGISNPVNPARGAWVKIKDAVVTHHFHKTSAHPERMPIQKKIVICRSVGCLCCLTPGYSPFSNWNWGFATVRVKNGVSQMSNYIITDEYEVVRL